MKKVIKSLIAVTMMVSTIAPAFAYETTYADMSIDATVDAPFALESFFMKVQINPDTGKAIEGTETAASSFYNFGTLKKSEYGVYQSSRNEGYFINLVPVTAGKGYKITQSVTSASDIYIKKSLTLCAVTSVGMEMEVEGVDASGNPTTTNYTNSEITGHLTDSALVTAMGMSNTNNKIQLAWGNNPAQASADVLIAESSENPTDWALGKNNNGLIQVHYGIFDGNLDRPAGEAQIKAEHKNWMEPLVYGKVQEADMSAEITFTMTPN